MSWLSKLGPKTSQAPEQPAEPAAPVAAAPGVTREELDGILGERFNAVLEQVAQIAGRPVQVNWPTQTAAAPTEPDITDEEINQALLTGQGAAGTVRKLVQREASKMAREVIDQHVNPLRDVGLGAISNLVSEHASATLPFYKKFKAAIDARMAQLTPDQQVNPAAIKLVHDTIVGENWQDVAETVIEQRTRQAADAAQGGNVPGGGASPHSRAHNDAVDLDDFGGKAALRALEFKDGGGQDLDTFAKKLGYASFKEYASIMPQLEAQYKQ